MSFLFPSFLWGLLALAIPIAIHIFNFRKTQRVYFSNVSFLKAIEVKTKSIRRIKQWLVLMMRLLAITCLVLAFAQPYFPVDESAVMQQKGITSIYLDNSYSMENEINGKRYIDLAANKLDEILSILKDQTTFHFVTNDFSSKEQSVYSNTEVRDQLTTLSLSPTQRDFESVYHRQKSLLKKNASHQKNKIFWISDFQKSTAGDLKNIQVDTLDRIFMVPLQAKIQKNIYVDSVWLNTPFIRELQNNILFVKVSNSGNEAVQNVILKLNLDGTQASSAAVDIPANGNALAQFNFNVKDKGFKKGQILFEDYPVTFDNNYYFVLNASPRIHILHIQGRNDQTSFIKNVYANDSLFVYNSYQEQNMDVGKIKNAHLIILEGLEHISGSLAQELSSFVKSGGSVSILPPVQPQETTYKSFLSGLGIQGLTMLKIAQPNLIEMALPDRNQPFFRDVFDESVQKQSAHLNLPTAGTVWKWNQSGETILALRNGNPFLSQISAGLGKVNLFTNPLLPTYGTFPQHALFVPVMYNLAALSIQAHTMAYTFDQNPMVIEIQDPQSTGIYKLRQDAIEIIPNQRIVGNSLLLELPQGDQTSKSMAAGYYELMLGETTKAWIAINHHDAESKLSYFEPSELRTLLANKKNMQVFDGVDDQNFSDVFQNENQGRKLWRYLLLGALLFLLAEILILRWYQSKEILTSK
jgi:hypothetical protein